MQFWPRERMIDSVEMGYFAVGNKQLQLEESDQFNNQTPIQYDNKLILKGE